MYKIYITIIIMSIMCVGCNQIDTKSKVKIKEDSEKKISQEFSNADNSEIYKLVIEDSVDLNNDNLYEDINIYVNNKELPSQLSIKVEINDSIELFSFTELNKLDYIEDVEYINTKSNHKQILIKLSTSENIGNPNSMFYGGIIIEYNNEKIKLLLNTLNFDIFEKDNYIINSIKDDEIVFFDTATDFTAKFKAIKTNPLEDKEYINRLSQLGKTDIVKVLSENSFNSIIVKDIDLDGMSEVELLKIIPGVYHNDTLAEIKYIYKFNGDRWVLYSEKLLYNSELQLPPIEEKYFK